MAFDVGSLVKARGREWVVLPESSDDLLIVRPLGGANDEIAGIDTTLEYVETASFALPDAASAGDAQSAQLLCDAVRLSFRSGAGPFRSFARLGFEPRPYQFVPLLMALRLDPVRLLIADDVGIGKTIEALLIAREMRDRGEIVRMAILCPPHLAEQWHAELLEKFHIESELVLSSTAAKLERPLRLNESLFDRYPVVVVSTDFIKTERRREEFLRTCPDFVIVDEAHSVAQAGEGRGARHQRHNLVRDLARKDSRHVILVTATPHSGNADAFRSLLGILNPELEHLPADLSGSFNETNRRKLARYFIQRRRADIRAYLDSHTVFPERLTREETYKLSSNYRTLFNKVLDYAREVVSGPTEDRHYRVRWWSALSLLRSLASSPAAAVATLRARASGLEAESIEDVDAIGERTVLDTLSEVSGEYTDVVPGSDFTEDDQPVASTIRARLRRMADEAELLFDGHDQKLTRAVEIVKRLIREGHNPIVFCRFIPTVEYVSDAMRRALRNVEIDSVTGLLTPFEREERVARLQENPERQRVLVCTDCLSEGIDLQSGFDAVVHYDLSWNPTRHEQREGRVDRYGQPKSQVKVVTLYGEDNGIDGIVLDVLLRKHETIRKTLGVSVPVPVDSGVVMEAVFEGLLLREKSGVDAQFLPGFEEYMRPTRKKIDEEWENATERERRSRTLFNQSAIGVGEVKRELDAATSASGDGVDVRRFVERAVRTFKGTIESENGVVKIDLSEAPRSLRDRAGVEVVRARFDGTAADGEVRLTRSHPLVEALAAYTMERALDPLAGEADGQPIPRCGAIRTDAVTTRTTLLLLRLRYHLTTRRAGRSSHPEMVEEAVLAAFQGAPDDAQWLTAAEAEALLAAEPTENIDDTMKQTFIMRVTEGFDDLRPRLEAIAAERARALLDAHDRVRSDAGLKSRGVVTTVEPQLPPDVLGIYVYLPVRRA